MEEGHTDKTLLEVFQCPDNSSRGTPFWAWNSQVNPKKMTGQIHYFKEMGMGGMIVHSRSGLKTPYLGKTFMETVRACAEEAKRQGLYLHLYDEDRWPSGFGGGYVTRNEEYRARFLVFSRWPSGGMPEGMAYKGRGRLDVRPNPHGECLHCFLVKRESGFRKAYRCIFPDQISQIRKDEDEELWYLHEEIAEPSPWFNGETYMDTLNPDAVKEFIRITYERYKDVLGDEFGKTVPSIFTDEPQFIHKHFFTDGDEAQWMVLPWTGCFEEWFQERFHTSFLERIPEMVWDEEGQQDFTIRYGYHRILLERFTEAYCDQIGRWCQENGILLTGHMKGEGTLALQAGSLGEAMRNYRCFHQPGIDILCDKREYLTAKQVQSAARQMGKSDITGEVYGVTGWEFSFAGHKLQGDWLAVMGVTRRVPHLSWASMEGEAKRDFPASIFYQSPWYEQYSLLETYFARIGSVLKAGKPVVHVGVLHPIESFWIDYGRAGAEEKQKALEEQFSRLLEWLLFGMIDFDLISEALLETLDAEVEEKQLRIGEMRYSVILVPALKTIRSGTLRILESFLQAGGQMICVGQMPGLVDGKTSMRPGMLMKNARHISFTQEEILDNLEDVRDVESTDEYGKPLRRYLYQLRKTEEGNFLFLADGLPFGAQRKEEQRIHLYLRGIYRVECWDPLDGSVKEIPSQVRNRGGRAVTHLVRTMYRHDSLFIHFCPRHAGKEEMPSEGMMEEAMGFAKTAADVSGSGNVLPSSCRLSLQAIRFHEPNVLLLDQARFQLDGGEWEEKEEILRLENRIRKRLKLPLKGEDFAQPWVSEEDGERHSVTLQYTVNAKNSIERLSLALENGDNQRIWWNGREILENVSQKKGKEEWYVDQSIRKIFLGDAKQGQNSLLIQMEFSGRSNLEACYLLGDFQVNLQQEEGQKADPAVGMRGSRAALDKGEILSRYGDISQMGYPFYSGNLEYIIEAEVQAGEYLLEISHYTAPLLLVELDGKPVGQIAFAPYRLYLGKLKGRHQLCITSFGNRQNTFGPLHNRNLGGSWIGPSAWRAEGSEFTYGYMLRENGILMAPALRPV